MTDYIDLNRKFLPVEADKENDPESIRTLLAFGIGQQLSWDDLLKKDRTVIIAEPGTGKTEEFLAVTKRLRMSKKLSFFCRIELLYKLEFKHSFYAGTGQEFDQWLHSDREGYFFLDSVDEARLSDRSAFEIALQRFANTIGENSNRAKVFVSCRVSNWRATADLSLFSKHLPRRDVPAVQANTDESEEEINQANKIATSTVRSINSEKKEDHIVFQLAPLNDSQIRLFAAQKGVKDTKEFIEAINRADANIFAERPQDLLDLIAYWRSNGCLSKHASMLDFNIQKKLEEHNPDRDNLRPLSPDDALLGAERMAAAVTLQKKKAIILPDIPINDDLREASIQPKESLPDWSSDKVQTLLDRAIFDEAIYGTVRFHHRTVQEYLVAIWIKRLIKEEKSRRLVEGLLFSKRYGRDVVIPSMRPVAAWLSLWDDRVRNKLRKIAPEVLIENGDPSSLPIEFRKFLIIGFAEHYAHRKYTGTSFDISMIRRLADPLLGSTVNNLLIKFRLHDDVSTLLLKLIWQGRISESVDSAVSLASDDQVESYNRTCAIKAVAAAGTFIQQRNLVNSLLAGIPKLSSDMLAEVCSLFFPKALSTHQLLKILKYAKTPKQYSASQLQQSVDEIANNPDIPEKEAKKLLQGLYKLLKSQPFIERRHCKISQRYGWLLQGAISLANQFIQKRHEFSFNPIVLDLFLDFVIAQDYDYFYTADRDKLLKEAKSWSEFRHQLFWHAIAAARNREIDKEKYPTEWWQVRWNIRNFWVPSTENLERLFEDLNNRLLMNDRLIALTAIFAVYLDQKRPRKLRERMKRSVIGTKELETKLHTLFHPKPLSEQEKKWRRQDAEFKKRQKEREEQKKIIRLNNAKAIKRNSADIMNVGNAQKGEIWQRTAYLYDRIREKMKEGEHSLGYANWRALEDEFGFEVASNFRDGCVAYWRDYDPFTYPDRRISNTIPWPWIIGLTGLAIEAADDPNWAKKISHEEAQIAAHYSVSELSGFPNWFNALQNEFPDIVEEVIKNELRWELHESLTQNSSPRTLAAIRHGNKMHRERYRYSLFNLLAEQEPTNDIALDYSLSIILGEQLDATFKRKIAKLAENRFKSKNEKKPKYTWLIVLLCIDGIKGCRLLNKWIRGLSSVNKRKEAMVNFCSAIMDHGDPRFGPAIRDYEKIEVLSELVPIIYKYVKVEDDIRHTNAFTPGIRDNAQQTRSHLLNLIFDTPGQKSYDLLMKLSNTVSYSFSKDRMEYLAKERAALDAEFKAWTGSSVAEFSLSPMKTPRSEKDLFELALVRLDDLKLDIEEGDESEAVLLQQLKQETEVRIIFANRLRKSSRSLYTIGSEEELANADRTDIRFNAPQAPAPVPIELKIADKWTFKQLRERMKNQLIGQYMRASKYGIFLLVHNGKKKRGWRGISANKLLSFNDLIGELRREIDDLLKEHPNVAGLDIVGIDFTIR